MSLSTLVATLITEGTLSEVEHHVYKCECSSSRTLKRTSLRRHLKSKRHLAHTAVPERMECGICYDDKSNFWTCSTCKNNHCSDCHKNIRNRKCPFCRSPFRKSRYAVQEIPPFNRPSIYYIALQLGLMHARSQ